MMTKRILKKMYRAYIFGTGLDNYKMRNGESWDKMIPAFARLPEKEREAIHQEWFNRQKKQCDLAA